MDNLIGVIPVSSNKVEELENCRYICAHTWSILVYLGSSLLYLVWLVVNSVYSCHAELQCSKIWYK